MSTLSRAVLILLTCYSIRCSAQFSPINFYKITNQEGLSQATVNVLFKDRDGFLWIGTDDGLNRFDGKKIKTFYYQFNDPTTLAANEVYGICEDNSGRLWIAHYNAGISIYNKSENRFLRMDNIVPAYRKLSSSRVYGLITDSKGFIWARTVYGISKIDPASYDVQNFDDSTFSDINNTINQDIVEFEGQIWFGSQKKGLLRVLSNGTKNPVSSWDIKKHGATVAGIWKDKGNELLIVSEKGVYRLTTTHNQDNVKPVIEDSALFRTATKVSRDQGKGLLWVATGKGLVIINTQEKRVVRHLKSESVTDNLLSNIITCVLHDDEKNTIVGTNRGVNISSPSTSIFNNYENTFRKFPDFGHPVYAIQSLEDGNLLIGTKNGGAWYFKPTDNSVTSIPIPGTSTGNPKIFHFTPITKNTFLLCSSQGLWELKTDNKKITVRRPAKFPELDPLSGTPITDLVFYNDSIAYIAGFTDGFYKWNYKKGTLKQYRKDPLVPYKGPVGDEVLNIVPSKDSNLILCTKFGFSIYYPYADSFLNVLPGRKYPYELPARNIKDAFDDGTNIWLATFGAGVQRFNKRTHTFSGYTIKEGLPNNSVYAVTVDNNGSIWIPTNNGLAVMSAGGANIKTFTTADGLPDNEFNAYASYKAADGSLFFSTLNGIVNAYPDRIAINPYLPRVAVTYFQAYSQEKDTVFNIPRKAKISVPAGFNSLYFEFAALSFAAPEKNQYKIKLENFDDDWIDMKNLNFRRYTNVPPGHYIFQIMGSNNSGKWSADPYSINIFVTPFWYQTIWFKLLIVLAALCFLYGLYRYRVSQILRVERLRRKISSDLHDDIGSTLSSINIYSELAKHEEDNKPYIETIQQHTRSIINNLDDLVWSINPRNDTISILADRMRAFAEPFLAAKNIACDFVVDIPDEESTLSLDRRQHVYLLFKEMVNNVVKHSQCSYCRIQFIQKGKHVYLSVRDNGRGFNVTNNHTSRNGLHNLNERTRQLKGHLLVESSPGKGTELQLDMQL